jgi:hypothetical protein
MSLGFKTIEGVSAMRRQLSVVSASAIALTTVGLLVLGLHTPAGAAAVDPATVVRGSLGVSLEDLGINSAIGELSFYLNGGLALLFGALAALVVRVNGQAKRTAPVPGGRVRATMGDAWTRLSRRMSDGHWTASRH